MLVEQLSDQGEPHVDRGPVGRDPQKPDERRSLMPCHEGYTHPDVRPHDALQERRSARSPRTWTPSSPTVTRGSTGSHDAVLNGSDWACCASQPRRSMQYPEPAQQEQSRDHKQGDRDCVAERAAGPGRRPGIAGPRHSTRNGTKPASQRAHRPAASLPGLAVSSLAAHLPLLSSYRGQDGGSSAAAEDGSSVEARERAPRATRRDRAHVRDSNLRT